MPSYFSMSALPQGFSSDEELQKAQRDLVDATEAATCTGPNTGVSAFASPGIQKRDESDVSQAKDLLGKVDTQPAVCPACISLLFFIAGASCQKPLPDSQVLLYVRHTASMHAFRKPSKHCCGTALDSI